MTREKCLERFPPRVDSIYTSEVVYLPQDTFIKIQADTSALRALIDCEGEIPRLKQIIAYTAGKEVKIPIVKIRHDTLFVDCIVDSAVIAFRYYERHTDKFAKSREIIRENYLTGWQLAQVWAGRILGGILLFYLLLSIGLRVLGLQNPLRGR